MDNVRLMDLRASYVDDRSCSVGCLCRLASVWSMPGRIAPGDSDVPTSWTTVFSGLSGVLGAGVGVVVAGGAAKTAGAGVAFTSLLAGGFVTGAVFLA